MAYLLTFQCFYFVLGLFLSIAIEPTFASPVTQLDTNHNRIQHSIFNTLQDTANLYGWQNVKAKGLLPLERSVRSTTDLNKLVEQTLQLATELGSVLENHQNLFESATGDHYKKYIEYAKSEAINCQNEVTRYGNIKTAEIEEVTTKWNRIINEIHETLLIIKDHVERRKNATETLTPAVAVTSSLVEGNIISSSQQNNTEDLEILMQSIKQSQNHLQEIISAIEQTRNDFNKGFVFNMTEHVNNLTSVFSVEIEPLVEKVELRGLQQDSREQLLLLDKTLKTLITNALALHRTMKTSLDKQKSLESLKELRLLMQNFHNLYEEMTKNGTADSEMISLKTNFDENVLKQYVKYNDMPEIKETEEIQKLCDAVNAMIKTLKDMKQQNINIKLIEDDLKLSQDIYADIKEIVSRIKQLENGIENEITKISKNQDFNLDMTNEFDRLKSEFQSEVNLKFESFGDTNFHYGSSEELQTLKSAALAVESSFKTQLGLLIEANIPTKLHPSSAKIGEVTAGLFTQLGEIIHEFSQQYEHTLTLAKNLTGGHAAGYNEILTAELTEFDENVRTLYNIYRSNENSNDFTDDDLRRIIAAGKKKITNLNLIKYNISNELLKMTVFKTDNQEFVALMDELIAKIEGFHALKVDVENFLKDENLPNDIQEAMVKQKEKIDSDSHEVLSKYEEMKKINETVSPAELEDLRQAILKAENIFTSMENLREILEKKTVTEIIDKEIEELNQEQIQEAIDNEIGSIQGTDVTQEPLGHETFAIDFESPDSFSTGSEGLLPNYEGEPENAGAVEFTTKSATQEVVSVKEENGYRLEPEQKDKIIQEINTWLDKYDQEKNNLNTAYNTHKSQLTAEFRAYFENRLNAINSAISNLVMGEFEHLMNSDVVEEPYVDEMTNLQFGAEHMYKLIISLEKRLQLNIEKIENSSNGTIAEEGKKSTNQ